MKIDKIVLPEPPNVLKSIRNGFDAITKHLVLLLFPVGIDLVLWFAPHLQLKTLIEGLILEMNEVSAMLPADFSDVMEAGQEIWLIAAERINLFLVLRSVPVGIFSLLTSVLPIKHPLGTPVFWDVPSPGEAILISVGIFLIGLGLASIYFSSVRQAALFDEVKWGKVMRDWPRTSLQSLLLSFIWLILFLAILIVGSCAATGVTFFSITLGQVVIILFGIVSFWLIFPLFFSPHGIFSQGEKAWKSLIDSIRFTNLTFMRTSLFIIVAIMVNQGLNIVWQIPPEDSWLMVISIIGHAFVTTGMLAASFVYYQDMIRWVEEFKVLTTPNPIVQERPTMEK
jgi:hypothetical protein